MSSRDLQSRVCALIESGLTRKAASEYFRIPVSAVERFVTMHRRETSCAPADWPADRYGEMPDSVRERLYDGRRYDLDGGRA